MRNKIIKGFQDGILQLLDSKEQSKEINLEWMPYPNNLQEVIDGVSKYDTDGKFVKTGDKSITTENLKSFLDDILYGGINNKKYAGEEFLKKLYNDRELLEKEKSKNTAPTRKRLIDIIDNLKNSLIELFHPSPIQTESSTNGLVEMIIDIDYKLNSDLIKKYFGKESLEKLLDNLNNRNKKSHKNANISIIDSNLLKLKTDIKKMSKD